MFTIKGQPARTLLGYAFLLAFSISSYSSGIQICQLAHKAIAGEEMTGQEKFELAQALKNASHPTQEKNGGTRIEIPTRDPQKREAILNDVITELQKFYRLEGEYAPDGEKTAASPNQGGNIPHIFRDHDEMAEVFAPDFQTHLDIDPLSLRVAVWAHDPGKARLDTGLQAYINSKMDEAGGNGVLNRDGGPSFVRSFVLPHDEHTFVDGLPAVMRSIQKKHDLSDEEVADLMGQIAHTVSWHNYGPLHVDPRLGADEQRRQLKERYPDLTDAEIERVRDAFWVKFYGNGISFPAMKDGKPVIGDDGKVVMISGVSPWAPDMGLSPVYGQPRGAAANAVAGNDRVTLVTEGGMYKIPVQNISRSKGLNRDLIDITFIGGDAVGVSSEAIIKAQHAEQMRNRPAGSKPLTYQQFRPTAYGLHVAQEATRFGHRLAAMNTDGVYEALNIDGNEAKRVLVYTNRPGAPKTGKTYKVDGGKYDEVQKKLVEPPRVYQWDKALDDWVELKGDAIPRSGQSELKPGQDAWDQILEFERLARVEDGPNNKPYIIPSPREWVELTGRDLP
ncbi:MAG: hypothetical protein H6617_02900 [Bdellovibrionaceae bacterium]|nr:hypothetical protein [Bdellovibrionales bacterium]MCB9253610.1 hypothetical protein [Pseudobdellovibrionaceae bacterium]